MNDGFYIGWEAKSAPGIGKITRVTAITLLILSVMIACAFAVSQSTIAASVFEWGNLKIFSGVLRTQPYPHLLVPRPGFSESSQDFSTYYLVAPWKFGLDPKIIAPLDGKFVTLRGTLIYRDHQTMIEVADDSLRATNTAAHAFVNGKKVSLGKQTLVGEIVDSKCFLGVMNPGHLTPHRACAVRCISGGCPPLFIVRQADGSAKYLLLVSGEGKSVNKEVLDMVAEPLSITGDVEQQDALLILRADPATYHRIKQ